MISDHAGGALPPSQETATRRRRTIIITVCIRGADRKPAPKTKARAKLLQAVIAAVLARADWPSPDAIQLPGGFFRMPQPIGHAVSVERRRLLAATRIGTLCAAASRQVSQHWPGCALAVGIDSERLSKRIGGDQLNVAWQYGAIVALARKAFPTEGDTDGSMPAYWVRAEDFEDPGRILPLRNGSRALLLSCYDAFAIRAIAGLHYADLRAPNKTSSGP